MGNEWLGDRWIGTSQVNTPEGGSEMAFPWLAVATIAASVLPYLFEGDDSGFDAENAQEMQQALENMGLNAPYQSPYLEDIDPAVAQSVLQNYSRYSDWGFPEGMGMDTGFLNDVLGSLNPKQIPDQDRF